MIAEIERVIGGAGFGQTNRERASVYMTEAEAAAVYASKQSMVAGEVFLVCDAGGGTTDLNVLRVESASIGSVELSPLSWTEVSGIAWHRHRRGVWTSEDTDHLVTGIGRSNRLHAN